MKKLLIILLVGISFTVNAQRSVKLQKVDTCGDNCLIFTLHDTMLSQGTYKQKVRLWWDEEPTTVINYYKSLKANKQFDTAKYCPVGSIFSVRHDFLINSLYVFKVAPYSSK